MLDLGKPYGTYDGIVFYGDHADDAVVYYFPDRVSLAQRDDGKGALSLNLFSKNTVSIGSEESLLDGMGSILQLDVVCQVEKNRLNKALEKVKKARKLPETVNATPPLWVDGSVQLTLLDATSTGEKGEFVSKILPFGKPSLSAENLKSSFMARLDRIGSDLVYSSLVGKKGSFAVVYYTLSYEALRPARDLRIWANLKRCQETVSHELGIDVKGSYEGVEGDIDLDLEWLTTKMEENGDIQIECTNYVPGEDELTAELVKDFKEQVIKELFEVRQVATNSGGKERKEDKEEKNGKDGANDIASGIAGGLSNGITNAMGSGGSTVGTGGAPAPAANSSGGSSVGPANNSSASNSSSNPPSGSSGESSASGFDMPIKVGISYSYRKETIKEDRIIEVNYNQASAVVRMHTPQSGLWLNSQILKGNIRDYVSNNTTSAWNAQSTVVRLLHDFDDPMNDLNSVRVLIWRAGDGLQGAKDGFQNPQDKKPLYNRQLVGALEEGEKVEWASTDENDIGYYYQLQFDYAAKNNICSPTRIITAPVLSYSLDLPIFPNQYAFYKRYPISAAGVDWSVVSSVSLSVDFVSKDGTSETKRFMFNEENKNAEVIIRGKDEEPISVFVTKKYSFKKNMDSVETTPMGLFYDEIDIPHPTYEKDVSVRMTKPSEDILNIELDFEVHSDMYGTVLSKMVPIDPSAGRAQVIQVPVYDMTDTIFYKVYLFTEGEVDDTLVAEGSCPAKGNIRIGLDLSGTRSVAFVWKGESPKSLGMKTVTVILKDSRGMPLKDEDGQDIIHSFEEAESWEAQVPAHESILMDLKVQPRGRNEEVVKRNLSVDFDHVEISARPPYLSI